MKVQISLSSRSIKVTFTLKDLTDAFYEGHGESIKGLNNMSDAEKFKYLHDKAMGDMRGSIKIKIGRGSFADRVELNSILRGNPSFEYSLAPRKGYKLATFLISA